MRKAAHITINLIPKDPFLTTSVGRLMTWGLTIGRYLVIFTELMVVFSFASRFNLDRQITDLNKQIVQRKAIISSFGDLEKNVRDAQYKIEQYEQVKVYRNLADIFPGLIAITPANVRLSSLTIQAGSISLNGTAQDQSSLNAMIDNLKTSSEFANVTVGSIIGGEKEGSGYTFSMQADVVKKPL
jgi:Tfp pilus assembly protein PilN